MHRFTFPLRRALFPSLLLTLPLACGDQGDGSGGSAGAAAMVGAGSGGTGLASGGASGSASAGKGGSAGSAAGAGATAGSGGAVGGTGGAAGTGGAPSGGDGGSGAGGNGGSSDAGVGGDGGTGGAAGTAGSGGDGGTGATAGQGGADPSGGSGGSAGTGGASSTLAFTPTRALWTGARYYSGSTPSNRTSGPMLGPTSTFRLHNGGGSPATLDLAVTGDDAEFFEITSPASATGMLAAGADLDVTVRLVTDNARLPAAPAQDDGATVLAASLGSGPAAVSFYALVLTYVELEPTFGQILEAFPQWDSNIPVSIRNDANPNPGTLPGVQAGTDEVAAATFTRADGGKPVEMIPIGRFSPPGLVPFGFHTPGNAAMRTVVGTMAQMTDAHTNNKSRMLSPPLASGTTTFQPSAAFSIFMEPSGVGTLSSDDAEGFDGAHRVKVWKLRDGNDTLIPNAYLVGGEEAANGDYQDYVFVLMNVTPG